MCRRERAVRVRAVPCWAAGVCHSYNSVANRLLRTAIATGAQKDRWSARIAEFGNLGKTLNVTEKGSKFCKRLVRNFRKERCTKYIGLLCVIWAYAGFSSFH